MNPLVYMTAACLNAQAPDGLGIDPVLEVGTTLSLVPVGGHICVDVVCLPARVVWQWRDESTPDIEWDFADNYDLNGDGDSRTDADIEAFFAALADGCCSADWDGDGEIGTDADVAAFFGGL